MGQAKVSERVARVLGRALMALALLCALCAGSALVAPTQADALTTNKATARPNEDGGDRVIGGIETRLTWEGTPGLPGGV